MDHAEDGSQIVFFDVEIETIYSTSVIVEFGAIFVCPNTLTELRVPYSTFVQPANPSLIPAIFKRRNGINRDSPTFADIADTVYELLHERIWAGHDIVRFDCMHITKAFSELNRPPPEPKAIIDSLPLFTDTFGRRADDMKMASLATYFGLGQQTHRSLDDVRMNLEVLKHCATVLFLESSLSDIFTVSSGVSPNATPRSRSDGKSLSDMKEKSMLLSPVAKNQCKEGKNNPTSPIAMCSSSKGSESNTLRRFDMHGLRDELNKTVVVYEEPIIPETPPQKSSSSSSSSSVAAVSSEVVLEPEEISISCLAASFVPLYRGSQMIQLLHKGVPFQLRYAYLKIRFGINGRFQDPAGRPKLSFVVDLDPSQQILCKVLETLDGKAQRLCLESGSSSDWRPVVTRKDGFYPTVRLQIPRAESGSGDIYGAEIFERESSGNLKRMAFDKFDVAEVASLFKPGAFVSGVFSFDSYDYQQSAGMRLIAQTLVTHSN